MKKVSRRELFRAAGATGAAAALSGVGGAAVAQPQPAPPQPTPARASSAAPPSRGDATLPSGPHLLLNAIQAAFLEAAVDRLIPPDDRFPGASGAGVVTYIDRQLAGAYGAGERLYLEGPWREGTPSQGYQLPFTPAQLYRTAMDDIAVYIGGKYGGKTFEDLPPEQQDAVLRDLESGAAQLPNVPAPIFFETLLANTIEGFFADPAYGGNRDMVGWRMIGFPGAYAAYVDVVDQHGIEFAREPIGMLATDRTAHRHG